jgi:IS30 family transposase
MANQLKMAFIDAILTLHSQGWSQRAIARRLGVHRETVSRHVRLANGNAR